VRASWALAIGPPPARDCGGAWSSRLAPARPVPSMTFVVSRAPICRISAGRELARQVATPGDPPLFGAEAHEQAPHPADLTSIFMARPRARASPCTVPPPRLAGEVARCSPPRPPSRVGAGVGRGRRAWRGRGQRGRRTSPTAGSPSVSTRRGRPRGGRGPALPVVVGVLAGAQTDRSGTQSWRGCPFMPARGETLRRTSSVRRGETLVSGASRRRPHWVSSASRSSSDHRSASRSRSARVWRADQRREPPLWTTSRSAEQPVGVDEAAALSRSTAEPPEQRVGSAVRSPRRARASPGPSPPPPRDESHGRSGSATVPSRAGARWEHQDQHCSRRGSPACWKRRGASAVMQSASSTMNTAGGRGRGGERLRSSCGYRSGWPRATRGFFSGAVGTIGARGCRRALEPRASQRTIAHPRPPRARRLGGPGRRWCDRSAEGPQRIGVRHPPAARRARGSRAG
jgi:hypothetical protein